MNRDGLELDVANEYITVDWGGHPYHIGLFQIQTPSDLVRFASHIGRKAWRGTTPRGLAHFMELISRHKRWEACL